MGTPDIRDAERLQGFPEGWTEAAESVAKSSSRWKLVGNAVTVNVCGWIAQGISSPPDLVPDKFHSHEGSKWPEAAFGEKGKVWRVEGAHGPRNRVSLAGFLKYPVKPLSHRAVTGFLGRAHKGNLKYPVGFIAALTKYSETL